MRPHSGLVVFIMMIMVCRGQENFVCNSLTSCETCVSGETWYGPACRWCPLTNECHTFASIYNPCDSTQYITEGQLCYEERPSGRDFSPQLSFRNLIVSAATYSDNPQACLDKINTAEDIEVIEHIRGKCEDLGTFEYSDCFAYTAVSHAEKQIILTFRGVYNNDQLRDLITSIATTPMQPFPIGGRVQNYFKNAFDSTFPCAEQSVDELLRTYPEYDVVVAGDSFGAALATLAASSLVHNNTVPAEKLLLYTTGSPRVGDKEYALNHDRLLLTSWRVVHYIDLVAQLPPCSVLGCEMAKYTPYHVGKEIFYPTSEMFVDSVYRLCERNEDIACSRGTISFADFTTRIYYHQHYYDDLNIGKLCEEFRQPNVSVAEGCRRIDAKTLQPKN